MSLKSNYPLIIGNVTVSISAISFSISEENIENINQTEDGYDDVEVIRSNKTHISASYKCMETWAGTFRQLYGMGYHVVQYFDTLTKNYVQKNMRMRNYKETLVKNSDKLSVTNGIYQISFDLLEV